MARFIHARRRDGEIMFRDWCTVTDTYITEPMPRQRFVLYLLYDDGIGFPRGELQSGEALRFIDARLERAVAHGTSAIPNVYWSKSKDPMSDPWDTDKCGECGSFHHVYEANCCDDPEDSIGHKPKCEGT